MAWNFNLSVGKSPLSVDVDKGGNVFYRMFSSLISWLNGENDEEKLKIVLRNPAVLFVVALQCDLASLGKFYVYKDGAEVEKDPVLQLLNRPNPMQTGKQFVWDYMFWRMMGTANMYIDDVMPDSRNKLYWLQNSKIKFPQSIKDIQGKIILSDKTIREIDSTIIKYAQGQSEDFPFPYKKLKQFFDLSNGFGNWFQGASRLDALYKVVTNSDTALNSKQINLDFISKFFVAGKVDIENTAHQMMREKDKLSIRETMKSNENVFPTKAMVDVKRFIDNYGVIEALDKSFLNDYFLVGKVYGVPRDVLEAYQSSTYENQEKARGSHVSYTISPAMEDLCNGLAEHFGYDKLGKSIILDYSHLPFMQAHEKQRAESRRANAQALVGLVNAGAEPQEAADFLEIEVNMTRERNGNAQINEGSDREDQEA